MSMVDTSEGQEEGTLRLISYCPKHCTPHPESAGLVIPCQPCRLQLSCTTVVTVSFCKSLLRDTAKHPFASSAYASMKNNGISNLANVCLACRRAALRLLSNTLCQGGCAAAVSQVTAHTWKALPDLLSHHWLST